MSEQSDVTNVPVVVPGVPPVKMMPAVVPGESNAREQLAAIKPVVEFANDSGSDFLDPIAKAKQLVVDNYNQHRDKRRVPEMTTELVVVLWFNGSGENFKAICEFTVVHGLRYEVSYNARRQLAYIDVYKKFSNTRLENV